MKTSAESKKIYFIADLHLSESRPDITLCFLRFLTSEIIPNASALYILGDFFERWIGDDDDSSLNSEIAHHLHILRERQIALFFIHGNRDFLLGQQYASRSGMTLLPEHYVTSLNNQPTLLLHGDTLCIDDIDYQKFRQRIRHPLMQRLLLSLPLWLRKRIAKSARDKSKAKQQTANPDILDVNETEVAKFFEQFEVPTMIHGHTHRPKIHHYADHTRIVLGDWYTQGSFLTLDENGYQLQKIPFE